MATRKKYGNVKMQTFKSRQEWLAARGNTIGGSDCAAIMGLSKWRTNLQLWRIMMGYAEPEDISNKPFVAYGNSAEPIIRDMFKLHHPDWAVGYEPNNMFTNKRFPFAHASLDGWVETEDGKYGVLEIKTTEICSKSNSDEWMGRVPDCYFCQVLHYLMVTEFDFAVLCAELKVHRASGEDEWLIVERRIDRKDVLDDIAELERKERSFMWHLEDRTEPGLILNL